MAQDDGLGVPRSLLRDCVLLRDRGLLADVLPLKLVKSSEIEADSLISVDFDPRSEQRFSKRNSIKIADRSNPCHHSNPLRDPTVNINMVRGGGVWWWAVWESQDVEGFCKLACHPDSVGCSISVIRWWSTPEVAILGGIRSSGGLHR